MKLYTEGVEARVQISLSTAKAMKAEKRIPGALPQAIYPPKAPNMATQAYHLASENQWPTAVAYNQIRIREANATPMWQIEANASHDPS